VFENRVLREYLDPSERKQQKLWEHCIMKSFVYPSPNIITMAKSRKMQWVEHAGTD
jgi:hypothetical protein